MPHDQADSPDRPVLIARESPVTILTLNRPAHLNAFNGAMHQALRDALRAADDDQSCRVVVLTGSGRGFCTGQDLSERVVAAGAPPPDLGQSIEANYNPLIRMMRTMAKPIVAAVNGIAAGAGCNVALACDIVVAARSARFAELFARIGLIPDSGGTFIVPRLIGEARARAMMMLADPIDADTAAQWGLIWKTVDDAALMTEAMAIAHKLASHPPSGLAPLKRALAASPGNTLDAQLDLERDLQREAGRAPAYAQAVADFAARRAGRTPSP